MAKDRPTIKQLKNAAQQDIGPDAVKALEEMESKIIRLIQALADMHELEKEIGYTDQHNGKRHPGIRDEVERLLIKYNCFDGVQIEDFICYPVTGSGPDIIDPIELLRLGVDDAIIKKATRPGKGWTSVRVQRIKTKKHAGGAEF